MKTNELFKKKTVLSFEVFPPKKSSPINTIYDTLEGLKDTSPDFISVTYGAGGSKNRNATFEIASEIKNKYHIESVAHLPGIGLTRDDVLEKLGELADKASSPELDKEICTVLKQITAEFLLPGKG